jgi:hypothetical protein
MKDLYVLAADADMEAVFRAVLTRPDSLGIRPISFALKLYWKHDAGVFREGPELLRAVPKGEFQFFLVAFDHDGSGCNTRPAECAKIVQQRLDSCTFTDRSAVIVIAPELEEWLWCHPPAIGNAQELWAIADPKERLHQVFLRRDKRKPRPRDYEQIATRADLQAWNSSPSFRIMKTTLQNWFPAT